MENKNVKYYNENAELEGEIHNLVGEHFIKSNLTSEKKKNNKNFGIKMILATILFIILGLFLIFLALKNKNFVVIKVIGAILCFCLSFGFGVVAHAVLVPPKNVNYFSNNDK
ncbi:MAG: hypothetical protein IJN03_01105 [Bacilli bacterium]|nr:hypothetical protein [Bacilli bacterium]